DVFGCETASASFKESANVEQLNDRQHFGRGSQFEDREEVGQVVTQDVTGHRDGVFALAQTVDGVLGCTFWGHNLDFKTIGIVIGKVRFYLFDQLCIVCTFGIQPEDLRGLRCTSTSNGQLDRKSTR